MSDVIMPALGMAQDTGKLVKWLKQPGDAVAIGDQLFEVETDKSVMEVEAQAEGFLTQVKALDGDDVPVGQVIAVISATADDRESGQSAAPIREAIPTSETTPDNAPAPASEPRPEPTTPNKRPAETGRNGRILASPKAKRLAHTEGLNLGILVQQGHPQPYHVSDLARLRDMPDRAGQTVVMAASSQITARAQQQGSRDFIDWMKTDGAITVMPSAMFASFAAGAFRAATGLGTVNLHLAGPEDEGVTLRNPDFTRLSAAPDETDEPPTVTLHDLTEGHLTSLRLGDPAQPTLSIGADGDSYLITFEFSSEHLTDAEAIAFVSGLARRLADPLHHLV